MAENTKKKSKMFRKYLREGASLAREGLRIYSDFRGRKGWVQYGAGALSLWGEVDRILERRERPSEQSYLISNGMRKCLDGMGGTIKDIMDHSGIPEEKINITESSDRFVLAYNVLDTEICILNGLYGVKDVYCRCEEDALRVANYLVRKSYKNNISVNLGSSDRGHSFIRLGSIDVDFEFYNPTIDMGEFLGRLDRYQQKFGINRSAIFYGPPGTGKTTFAVKLAEELGGKLLVLSPSAITRMAYTDVSIDKLIAIIDPTVILLDDIDKASNLEKMLVDVESLHRQIRAGTKNLIIASANDLSAIPAPMKRPGRFDEIIEFKLPDKNRRKNLLMGYLDHFKIKKDDYYIDQLAELTKGFSPAYLREIALEASFSDIPQIKDKIVYRKEMLSIEIEEEKKEEKVSKKVVEDKVKEAIIEKAVVS